MVLMIRSVENISLLFFFSTFNGFWVIIYGLMIIKNSIILESKILEKLFRGIVILEAALVLIVHAILTWFLTPVLATQVTIDGIELLIFSSSLIMLCIFSFFLGNTIELKHMIWKHLLWLFGILTSVFVSLWLLGSPHIFPLSDRILSVAWIIVSLIIFSCYCIATLLQMKICICSNNEYK